MAIEPTGLDPCDLRLQHGPAAVRELVARRIPLYRFVMGNVIAGFDLDRAEAGPQRCGLRHRWSAASAMFRWSTVTPVSWPA